MRGIQGGASARVGVAFGFVRSQMGIRCLHIVMVLSGLSLLQPAHGEERDSFAAVQLVEQTLNQSRAELNLKMGPIVKVSLNKPDFVLLPDDRVVVEKAMGKYLSTTRNLFDKYLDRKILYRRNKAEQYFTQLSLNAVYYAKVASLFNMIFESRAIVDLVERDFSLKAEKRWLRDLQFKLIQQLRVVSAESTGSKIKRRPAIRNPSLATAASHTKQLNRWVQGLDSKELQEQVVRTLNQHFAAFFAEAEELRSKISSSRYRQGALAEFFYNAKASLLFLTGKIYLPRKHHLTESAIESIEQELLPGDIVSIRHYQKLTNIGFKGEWSHSVLYIGDPEKLSALFDSNEATTDEFYKRCKVGGLTCHNFSSYMLARHPKVMAQYLNGNLRFGRKVPYVAIEGKGEGIIFSNLYDSLMKDQLVALRPNLTVRERALAVAASFKHLGKPYDYNFNLRTNSRMVCTELIFNVYSPRPAENRRGIVWETSQVFGNPVMYGEDVVRTYFAYMDQGEDDLELVTYVRPDSRTGELMFLGHDDLRETISTDVSLQY